jgi:hypothetical protein
MTLRVNLVVTACRPDKFGIPHTYVLTGPVKPEGPMVDFELTFQSGDPRNGWNGGTTLAWLAAIRDFLECCQATQFGCPENEEAITHLTMAMAALQGRIIRRAAEGTFQTHQGEKPAVS